jgi:hypothetical protein
MDNEYDVTQESSPEEVAEVTQEVPADEELPAPAPSEPIKAEKTVPYERFKKINEELKQLKNQPAPVKTTLDVEDYLDISTALDGMDQKQKEYLASQHKLTGRPLTDIRNSEDFSLWNTGYQTKVEREKALKPNGTQPDSERKRTLSERITSAKTLDEQEKLLREAGLYKENRPRADRTRIG